MLVIPAGSCRRERGTISQPHSSPVFLHAGPWSYKPTARGCLCWDQTESQANRYLLLSFPFLGCSGQRQATGRRNGDSPLKSCSTAPRSSCKRRVSSSPKAARSAAPVTRPAGIHPLPISLSFDLSRRFWRFFLPFLPCWFLPSWPFIRRFPASCPASWRCSLSCSAK